jgi:3-oxoacyl-[acyl-carrier-protein] synthase II
MRRVVVTGVGVVTPIGTSTEAFWDGLMSGRPGAGKISAFDASDQPVRIACEASDFDVTEFVPPREVARSDRFTHMALAAAQQAWDQASPVESENGERTGVIVGTGIGGLSTIEREHQLLLSGGPRRVSPFMIPKLMPNAAAAAIAMRFGLRGPNYAASSACATGGHAIGEAWRMVADGSADMMLAGGTEAAITPLALAAFTRMGALSRRNDEPERASRPFDKGRDGFVMGEGAAVVTLEPLDAVAKRGAPVLAELTGYGASADAWHVTQPDPEGRGAALAMRGALKSAGVEPQDIDYINAHGTSTPYNDRVETTAVKEVFGNEAKRIPISSTKSQTGHLLGAAGAVEAVAAVLAIDRGVIPATRNLDEPDPECDLDYVSDGPRSEEVRTALSNCFGFGGQNACLLFTRPVE